MTQTIEQTNKAIKFYQNAEIKAFVPETDATGKEIKPRIRFVGSATTTDLYSDVMTLAALEMMQAQSIGKTVHLNHNFDLPDDVFGIIENAEIEQREAQDPVTGEIGNFYFLIFTARLATSNPPAVKAYELVQEGIQLGASVTIYIQESERSSDGRNFLNKVYFLEVSIVSIPANQSSWVEQLGKAIKAYQDAKQGQAASPVKSANSKEVKKMPTKPTKKAARPRYARKNVFDEILAANATATCGDLCQGLCQAIDSALQEADGGGMDDPAGAIKQLLSDFTDAVMSQVQPALDAMASETPEDETEEAESGAGDDTSTASDGADDSEVEKAFKRVKAFLAYRKARKDATDWLDPNNGDNTTPDATAPDDDFAQTIHDMAAAKGATCMGIGDPDKPVDEMDMGDLEGYSIPKGRGNFKALKTLNKKYYAQILELKAENEKWAAIGPVAMRSIENLLKQPINQ